MKLPTVEELLEWGIEMWPKSDTNSSSAIHSDDLFHPQLAHNLVGVLFFHSSQFGKNVAFPTRISRNKLKKH
jgi:hypothetical protein